MAKLKTNNIFIGDSFEVKYKCWRHLAVQERRTQFGGTEQNVAREPVSPSFATVQLVNFETNTVIPLGKDGSPEARMDINGNEVSFLIDGTKFAEQGSYRVYTRVSFVGERRITEVIQFRVQAIG